MLLLLFRPAETLTHTTSPTILIRNDAEADLAVLHRHNINIGIIRREQVVFEYLQL
ncbi:MAG: hypothetical protein IT446_12190 [Phycisphaerales bacterium]|nr:hypothetical protein [Phycisphaerales bacterium]